MDNDSDDDCDDYNDAFENATMTIEDRNLVTPGFAPAKKDELVEERGRLTT